MTKMCFQFWYFLFLIILNSAIVKGDDDGDYTASMGIMFDCIDFDNKNIDVTKVTYETIGDDEQQGMKIGGSIVLNYDIDERTQFHVKITKEHEGDKEVVLGIGFDFCESIDDEHAPHKSVLEALGITKCPVKAGEYKLEGKEISIKLDDFRDYMNENYVGQYIFEVSFDSSPTTIDSCHCVEISIYKC